MTIKSFNERLCVRPFMILFCTLAACTQFALTAGSQQAADQGSVSNKLIEVADRRVFFDTAPFSPGAFVPYWDNGYLISKTEVEVIRPGTPTVRLYDAKGTKVKEVSLWFAGSERIFVGSVAVTSKGKVAVSGMAVKSDGTRAPYLALFDDSGKVSNVIQTSPFFPSNICFAPDDTIWSFGSVVKDPNEPILRHFDFQKGQLAAYLPRSSFNGPSDPSSMRGDGQDVYLRCTSNRAVIYTEVAEEYIEVEYSTEAVHRWKLDRSQNSMPIRGRLAATPAGEIFAVLGERFEKPGLRWGLFNLQVERPSGKARWLPVEGHVSDTTGPRIMTNLLGADQNGIVFMNRDDWPAVFWAKPKNRTQ